LAEIPQIEIEAHNVLNALTQKFPQTSINGSNNIWIVKPAGLSRGRGIKLFSNFAEINRQIQSRENPWVIQKYIETPALINGKKFDIRQWVLVTDWNPLTIWFYNECYIRFSGAEFCLSDIKNKFAH
jgi:tubulin monoglycylase TTLL3/8